MQRLLTKISIFEDISKITTLNLFHLKLVRELCGSRIIDLLLHLPRSYVKRKLINTLREIVDNESFILCGIVSECNIKNNALSKIIIEFDGIDSIEIVYFRGNKQYLEKLYRPNARKALSGKITKNGYKWQMVHPTFVLDESRLEEIPKNEPIYDLTKGITNQMISDLIKRAINSIENFQIDEWLPQKLILEKKFPSSLEALKILHNIDNRTEEEIKKAKERLFFDELLAKQISLKLLKFSYKSYKGRAIEGDSQLRNIILKNLDFELTNDQQRAIKDIFTDQASKLKMVRMLQGDVGSGKTIVALLAMLNAIEVGFTTILMVPTEILAQQHFESISSILNKAGLNLKITLLTSNSKKKKKLLDEIANNEFQIIIGTHAIFQDKVQLNNIGLIVIDEQHRFGVNHRASLTSKDEAADLLFMSATPIPRSLSLVQYGYMDHSLIVEKPKNRLSIITNIVSCFQIEMVIGKISEFISRGEKVYWICPLIEESMKLDIIAIENRAKTLKMHFGNKLAVIHGRMKDTEINEIMKNFSGCQKSHPLLETQEDLNRSSLDLESPPGILVRSDLHEVHTHTSIKTDLLLSTTLIEVGVNVPAATLIIIEDAQRFGLSQLHQLRGRVGRGEKQSYCVLIYNPKSTSQIGRQRLQALKESNDGFYIAEQDLKLRGSGELTGLKQSGFSNYKVSDIESNTEILSVASRLATEIVEQNNSLEKLEEKYKTLLKIFQVEEINSGGF